MARKLPDPLDTLQPHTLTSGAGGRAPQVRQIGRQDPTAPSLSRPA